jgi:hypothetical protein
LYSGELDTYTVLALLRKKYSAEVITVTVNVGQGSERKALRREPISSDQLSTTRTTLKESLLENYVFKVIKANALYEGKYPLGTALARYVATVTLAHVKELANKGLLPLEAYEAVVGELVKLIQSDGKELYKWATSSGKVVEIMKTFSKLSKTTCTRKYD